MQGGSSDTARSGIAGLDAVLGGGFKRGSTFLIEGESGSGKTMLALAFAAEGAANGEPVVYISLAETKGELQAIAGAHGWDIGKIQIIDAAGTVSKYTLFHPSEVELDEVMKGLRDQIERHKPSRVVIDSLSEIRLITESTLRYRREMIGLKRFLGSLGCTSLLLKEPIVESSPRTIVDGVVLLENLVRDYGGERRRVRVLKYRGRGYAGGFHDFSIRRGGLQVFPRLVAREHRTRRQAELLPSGLAALDTLLGGGVMAGSSTLVLGPAGTGKSSLAMQFANSAAERGQNAAIFTFDERPQVMLERAAGLGMNLKAHMEAGLVRIREIDPAEISPGEFTDEIRREVESHKPAVLVIDSFNGYFVSMPDERFLVAQMHELLNYLGHQGVTSFVVMGQVGIFGEGDTPASTSYLTDNILLLRHFEAEGEVRRAISVVKKRSGKHERTIRELEFAPDGIHIGEPLRHFHGILMGSPSFTGMSAQLLKGPHGDDKRE